MKNKILIKVEGHVDEVIVTFIIERIFDNMRKNLNLNISYKEHIEIKRTNGIFSVIGDIIKHDGNCIGIIDQDKDTRMPRQIKAFHICNNVRISDNLNFHLLDINYNQENNNIKYLVIIKNGHENWIDNCFNNIGLNRTSF